MFLRIKPRIDETFSTIEERKGNFIVGSSLGAIFAFTTAYEYSDVFIGGAGLSFPAFAYEYYVFNCAHS